MITTDGQSLGIKMQVSYVNKVLVSVSRLAYAGNRTVFEEKGGYVEKIKGGGKKIELRRKNGVYVFDLLVKSTKNKEDNGWSTIRKGKKVKLDDDSMDLDGVEIKNWGFRRQAN